MLLASLGLLARRLYIGKAVSANSSVNFVEFESGPVRPIAMSPDGNTLFAANTPNGTLEVFSLASGMPVFQTRVPVGLEPVAVAVRNNTEVWVANLLSDSVSVVSLAGTPHVTATLLVGDEPRDIVFAGNPPRAFIATAHRGRQRNRPVDRQCSRRGRSAVDDRWRSARRCVGIRPRKSRQHDGWNAAPDHEFLHGTLHAPWR